MQKSKICNIVYTEQSTDIHKKNRDVQKAGMQQTHLWVQTAGIQCGMYEAMDELWTKIPEGNPEL